MSLGWVKLHRQLLDWEWYEDINTSRLFIHLLLIANHKDKKWRGVLIKKGEKLTSQVKLSEETGLTRQQVRTSLNKLKSTNDITIKTTAQHTVIYINNWDLYQDKPEDQPTSNQRATNEQPTSNQRITTNKNVKNDNNEKEIVTSSPKANLTFEIFRYWCDVMKKNISSTKLTAKRDKAIKNRLKDGYTFDQIKAAIDGCRNDPFSMGQNDRQKPFNDIELICRTGEKLESFLDEKVKQKSIGRDGVDLDDRTWADNFKLRIKN